MNGCHASAQCDRFQCSSRRSMEFCVWPIALVMLICTYSMAAGQSSTTQTTTLSLRNYGWQPPDPIRPREVDTPIGGTRSIAVDHQGRVVVGFVVREHSGLVTRDQPALYFHVMRFANEGNPELSLSLPTNGWRTNSLYLSDSDQIIVRADDKLQLLQSDPVTGQHSWKELASCPLRCQIFQSPSRRILLLNTWDVDPPIEVIDASQLSNVQRCEKLLYPIHSITDKFAYFSGENGAFEHFAYRWPICEWDRLFSMPSQLRDLVTVLNDQLFITDPTPAGKLPASELVVVSLNGTVEFRKAISKHEQVLGRIQSSETGSRFAVDIPTMRGQNLKLDIAGHFAARRIAVYDIEKQSEIASIPAKAIYRYRFEFTLSPDGQRLAMLEDDSVRVIALEKSP